MKALVELFNELRNAIDLGLLKHVVFDELDIALRISLYRGEFRSTIKKRAELGDYIQKNFEVLRIVWEREPDELTILLCPHIQSLLPKSPKILLNPDLYKFS
jgi:hypothetical protein